MPHLALRTRLAHLLPVLLALPLAACQPPQEDATPNVVLAWAILPAPATAGQPSTFTFELTDRETGEPVAGAAAELEANMSHPGMEPVLATAAEVAPGKYEAPLTFSMGGDWFVLVEAALPDGRTLHRQVDVPGVRAP